MKNDFILWRLFCLKKEKGYEFYLTVGNLYYIPLYVLQNFKIL